MREELLDHAAVVYGEVKERLKASGAWSKMQKSEYITLVRDLVDRYAVKTGIARELKELIVKILGSQWTSLQKQLRDDDKTSL